MAGIVVSSIALHVHLMDPNASPPCAVSEHWDCGAVGHSRFPGSRPRRPTRSTAMCRPASCTFRWRRSASRPTRRPVLALMGRTWLVFELAQAGFFFAAFLSYIEAYILEVVHLLRLVAGDHRGHLPALCDCPAAGAAEALSRFDRCGGICARRIGPWESAAKRPWTAFAATT